MKILSDQARTERLKPLLFDDVQSAVHEKNERSPVFKLRRKLLIELSDRGLNEFDPLDPSSDKLENPVLESICGNHIDSIILEVRFSNSRSILVVLVRHHERMRLDGDRIILRPGKSDRTGFFATGSRAGKEPRLSFFGFPEEKRLGFARNRSS